MSDSACDSRTISPIRPCMPGFNLRGKRTGECAFSRKQALSGGHQPGPSPRLPHYRPGHDHVSQTLPPIPDIATGPSLRPGLFLRLRFLADCLGHQQVTDAYSLGLAVKGNGVLVTLRQGDPLSGRGGVSRRMGAVLDCRDGIHLSGDISDSTSTEIRSKIEMMPRLH
jgi:hypothetical protein